MAPDLGVREAGVGLGFALAVAPLLALAGFANPRPDRG